MAYCRYCGNELKSGTNYCCNCGKSNNIDMTCNKKNKCNNDSKLSKKNVFFDGEIHKCPSCGEILNSFVSICPSCGYELRGTYSSTAITDFSNMISNCESEKKLISIIENFPIPNTKEDIFEFLVIAKSKIKNYDKNGNGVLDYNEKSLLNAWKVKVDQCYEKGKLILDNQNDIMIIEEYYSEINDFISNVLIGEEEKIKEERINEFSEDIKSKFDNSKSTKVLSIIGGVLCIGLFLISIKNGSTISALTSTIGFVFFIMYFIVGKQLVRIPIKNIYIYFMILGYIFVIISFGISGESAYDYRKTDILWNELLLNENLPTLENVKGDITTNTTEKLCIKYISCSKEDYNKYVKKCIDYGYSLDIDNSNFKFNAYNSSGYKLELYNSSSSELSITLTAPIEMNVISLPNSEIANLIPIPPSLFGKIIKDNNENLELCLGNVTKEQFNEYVTEVKNNGFDEKYRRDDENYHAQKNKYTIDITYEGGNIIRIKIYKLLF